MYDDGINYTNNILILIKLDLCNKDLIKSFLFNISDITYFISYIIE